MFLEKYIKGLSVASNELMSREHVDDLRADLETSIKINSKEIDNKRKTDLEEKK